MVIDIVLGVIILIFLIAGFTKGLLKSIISLCGNLFSLIIACLTAKPFASFLERIFGLATGIGNQLSSTISTSLPVFETPMLGSEIATNMDNSLFSTLLKQFIEPATEYANSQALATTVGTSLGALVSIAISAILAFILIKLIVAILSKVFDAITKQRAVNGMDRLLGGIFGLIKIAVILVVLMSVLYVLSPIIPTTWIDGTVVFKTCYTYSAEIFNYLLNQINLSGWISGIISSIV